MIDVSCALIIQDERVLIAQNSPASDHPFQWEFPGGKIRKNESAKDCIVREINEELEWIIEVRQELTPVEFDYGAKQIRLFPFVCNIVKGKLQLNDHVDIKWVSMTELFKTDLAAADKKLILLPENQFILKKYIRE